MPSGTKITSVTARQIYSDREHPGVEATVRTENGAVGIALCTAGQSVGVHEVEFAYDSSGKWGGKGVQNAVDAVNEIIAPALIGKDAAWQREVDDTILSLKGPKGGRLGGNATGAVSAAALKAGAAALGIPLYRHIGGDDAVIMPVCGTLAIWGSHRYLGDDRSASKPTYSFMCHGFSTFSDASYAAWEINNDLLETIRKKFGLDSRRYSGIYIPRGYVKHDRELWDLMVESINRTGYEGKVGLQVDLAAGTYYDKATDKYVGLFSDEPKSRDDLFEIYQTMTRDYPFLILEDPLDEEDYLGHAQITSTLGIQIVGDDLFTTNVDRLQQGIEVKAANTMLLKVYQIGTISEAFDAVQTAFKAGYGVMPCDSRGEGADIADYTVGLGTGHLREGALGPVGNRFLQIEAELGSKAKFLGRKALKP